MPFHPDPGLPAAEQYATFVYEPTKSDAQGRLLRQAVTFLAGFAVAVAVGLGAFSLGRQAHSAAFAAPPTTLRAAPAVAPTTARSFGPLRATESPIRPRAADTPRQPPASVFKFDALAPLVHRVRNNRMLSGAVTVAVGLAALCVAMPEVASAEAAHSFMTGDFFRGLADSTTDAIGSAEWASRTLSGDVSGTMAAVGDVARQTANRAQELALLADGDAETKKGLFALLVDLVKGSIIGIETTLDKAGIPQSAGLAITIFTIFIKGITFPLNYQQMQSTTKIQTLQPTIKQLQEKFKANPQDANVEIARLYKKYDINPLAALLPVFVQIPVFIALYRALKEMADQNLLDQPFLFLPSLEGPTFDAVAGHTTDWLTSGNLPPGELAAYLAIPVFLTISQFATTILQQVPGQEVPTWLYYLPLMTGAFSLNVPSGLSLYWIVNNVVTTGSTFAIKDYLKNSEETKKIAADLEEMAKGPARTFDNPYAGQQMSRLERRTLQRQQKDIVDTTASVADASAATAAAPTAAAPKAEPAAEASGDSARGGKGKGGKKKKR